MFSWLRSHRRLTDLAVAGSAVAVSVSLADQLGAAPALAVGLAVILIANVLIAPRSPSG
jgi:hypothetical protein